MRATDWQTFIIALFVLAGCFYGLLFSPAADADVRLALAGFAGAVITYFFGRQVAQNAAASTVRAVNNVRPTHEETRAMIDRATGGPDSSGGGVAG
jgi:hypothetical protein